MFTYRATLEYIGMSRKDLRDVPFRQVTIEILATKKHVIHSNYIGHIPRRQVTIEILTTCEHV